uniref:Uncharacterized protein LOC100186742 n=1 Tax=Phallusia mammillata TaxID=59560 RepID=A0A6F9DJD8_9ASCI|nr:uncharacterized protein LOC100186742 [Phallusia mammillata]
MEKIRSFLDFFDKTCRKRINNSLEQLRKLLPYSVNMKKDMASLLEQTVEYINIMHTVLNEDKPACLNKVYLSYRQKTEQIETFRKNFKKTAAKKAKGEPGCSWGPPFGHNQQIDMNPFTKHPCMPSSYYDSHCIGNPMWQQHKMPDSFLMNQPTYSGQTNNHFLTVAPPTSSIHSRSLYYPPPTKQFECGSDTSQAQDANQSIDAAKSASQSSSKLGSWQVVTGTSQTPQHALTMKSNLSSPHDGTINKSVIFHNDNGEWQHPMLNQSPAKLSTENVMGKPQTEFYDENNNTTVPGASTKSVENKSLSEKASNSSVDITKAITSPLQMHCDITDGNMKCDSPQNKVSPPEMYFATSDATNISTLYGGFAWNALPPLSLNPNYLTANSQAHLIPNTEVNQHATSRMVRFLVVITISNVN